MSQVSAGPMHVLPLICWNMLEMGSFHKEEFDKVKGYLLIA